ncbi:MAG: Ig-like domain-containing protein [Chitinispirillaceae bacterium]|nr:Ig-like domain-containing protein [Chitinispirillaceae bacterium]
MLKNGYPFVHRISITGTFFLVVCLHFLTCELGEGPVGPKVSGTPSDNPTSGADYMVIRALPSTVSADNDESAVIEVTVFDSNHNPVIGQEITFSATSGIVSAVDTTNASGVAFATFTPEPDGGDATVSAKMVYNRKTFSVSTTVHTGITAVTIDSTDKSMRIRALPPTITIEDDQYSVIEVTIFDTSHNPVVGQEVFFSATSGIVTAKDTTGANGVAKATFTPDPDGGNAVIVARLDIDGKSFSTSTSVRVVGTTVTIDSVNNNMRIRAFPSALLASYDDKSDIEVTVFDDNRNPVAGKEVFFSSTRGVITAKSTTDDNGIASAVLTGEPINANVTVTAQMTIADSLVSVATTVTMSGITIVIIPQLTSAPLNAVVPVTIKLLDGGGEPVPDQDLLIVTGRDSTKTTDGAGEVTTAVTRSSSGTVTIRAAALGASDSTSVYFGTSTPIDNDNTIRSLRLFTSHAQLRADNSAEAMVTAVIISEDNHNPLVGDTVQFSSTLGIIDQFGVTDETGRTSVTLRSAPVNGNCVIRALLKGNSAIKDSTTVLFSGVTLELSADRNDLRINDTAEIEALLKDGSGNPISSDFVNFSVDAPGIFDDGERYTQATLSATGVARVKVTSGTAGKVAVYAASANVTDSIELTFTTNNLSVSASKTYIVIGGRDSTQISARYLDKSGNPLSGRSITFAASAGSLTDLTSATNSSGIATTWLKSGYFATEATVQAKSPDGSAYTTVTYRAASASAIELAITPDNIGVNGGIAELIATVKDDSGNVVTGAEVSFKILKGPGGGEKIDNPIIVSTNDGIARAQLLAGSLPSTYRGCEVEATVNGVSAASKLTISGEPHTVTISRPEDDTVKVPNAGLMDESTFEYFVGAVVKDVNGNPVADGTPVNFSALVSGMSVAYRAFDHWAGVESADDEIKPVYRWEYIDVPFEDVNGNLQMDAGIDLELDMDDATAARGDDVNGDGIMDYTAAVHDFKWNFVGAEPYWPASKEYIVITDTLDPRYRPPVLKVNHTVERVITPTVSEDHSTVTYDTLYYALDDTSLMYPAWDSTYAIYADLNQNGRWDRSPLEIDRDHDGAYDGPVSGDFEYWRYELRPQFKGDRIDFSNNDFAMVIDRTAVTKDGVAYTRLTYPRQLALRLIATINAEVKGIRDKDGERFKLPIIR